MDLLIIGGTRFVGRALVEAALEAGHTVTLFNRGQSNPDLFPQVEHLIGDRNSDLSALDHRTWGAVIDTCGYVPRHVASVAQKLADKAGHYTFISSVSVYDLQGVSQHAWLDEGSTLAALKDESIEEITGETYGGLKVLCERAAEAAMPGRTLHIRPGLIVGPFDPTDRFSYWPVRLARGGEAIAPPLAAPAQFIDVRDLAAWTIRMLADQQTGVYNVVGPEPAITFGSLVRACQKIIGPQAAQVYEIDEAFLNRNGVSPWTDLPVWTGSEGQPMAQVNPARAVAAGLTYLALEKTAADTLTWFQAYRSTDLQLKVGLSPEREAEVLRAWKEQC